MNIDCPLVIENLTTAALVLDDSLRLIYMNPAAEALFATSARQLVGQTVDLLLPCESAPEEALRRALEQGHPFTQRERQVKLPPGRCITVDCTVTPLLERDAKRALLVELQQVDRHRRIAKEEQLSNQYAGVRALLRGLAHEIKNPLGGLRGAAQLLQRELADPSLREYTRIIIEEADRLRNLVDRMLGPRAPAHKRWVNIHEVLEHVRRLLRVETTDEVQIATDYDPSIPDCFADREQLIQAVLNIGRNAVEAVHGAGEVRFRTRVVRHCTIGQEHHRLGVRIEVIDNGPGIPSDMIEHVFYPMVTGRAEGSGLGLPIAQALVNQHGGSIECTSQPGQTVFTLLLPLGEQG